MDLPDLIDKLIELQQQFGKITVNIGFIDYPDAGCPLEDVVVDMDADCIVLRGTLPHGVGPIPQA